MPQPRVYYYAPQRLAITGDLAPLIQNPTTFVGVHDEHQLCGLENFVFVENATHPERVPEKIRQALLVRGAVFWTIDDTWARNKAEGRWRVQYNGPGPQWSGVRRARPWIIRRPAQAHG